MAVGTPPLRISREEYNAYRAYFNENGFGSDAITLHDAEIGWHGFMGSRNGRFFDGGWSGHDENGRDYITEHIRNVFKQAPKLKGVEWHHSDYTKIPLPEHSTIYCDIPYKNTKQYSTSRNFDYERFYQWCKAMKELGHRVFVSEYNMPDDFKCVWQKEINNSIRNTKTYKRIEKLFIPS